MNISKEFNPVSKIPVVVQETARVAEADNSNAKFLKNAKNFMDNLSIETSDEFSTPEISIS